MSELLHSRILGSGRPLIILHGFLGSGDNWKSLGNRYAENGHQVHLIDQRNHGRSFHSDAFDYAILANDLKAYFDQHAIEKAVVIGHSMGGKTAMQFATDHPELVEKLLVADIAPKYYPPHHHEIIRGLKALNFDEIVSRSMADVALANYITDQGTRQFLLKNLYWAEKGRLGFRFNLAVLGTKMEAIGEPISGSAVYDGPSLFLRGDRSEYVSDSDLVAIKRHFPLAELDTIENAGHWLHAENPKQFFDRSLAFMKSQ